MSRVCNCPAYGWPHRKGGGRCIWSARNTEPTCVECGRACLAEVVRLEPEEISPHELPIPTEAVVSDCCGAEVVCEGERLGP